MGETFCGVNSSIPFHPLPNLGGNRLSHTTQGLLTHSTGPVPCPSVAPRAPSLVSHLARPSKATTPRQIHQVYQMVSIRNLRLRIGIQWC